MDTADNTPLDYEPLDIPDGGPAHLPAPVGSVGINIAAARLVFPHHGLRLLLPPWGDRMGRGDSYRIKLGPVPVLTGSIDEETQVGQWVERFIPVGGLVDGDFDLSYDVKILGDPDYRPSAVTKIHVKIDFAPPGGQDQNGDTPGHSELKLTIPPEFLPPGAVDQEAAKRGVPVTIEPYPIMAEGDRIKLSWGGEIVWKTVEKEHLPPQNTPLVITVDETTIIQDTDANGLAVVFEVYDVVDNKSEDWSAEVRVIVDTGNSRLTAPLIKEVFNLKLDVDQLGEADLTFQVIAVDANFEVGDEVEMHLTGTTAEGEKIDEVTFALEKIRDVPRVLEFKRPSAAVRQLAGGLHAAFFYRLIKADGSPDLSSKVFSPRIVGRANPLAAPIPLDEIAGTLDPQLPSTTIEIPLDPAMEEGNAIALIWSGTTESGGRYTPDLPLHPLSRNEAEGRVPIEIVVTGEHLTAIEGGTLDLYYKLLRDVVSREVIEEESLHADLLSIGIPQAELPLPVVEGESDGVLDPADKPNGTRLIVRHYSGQKAGDRVHSLWWGSSTGRYRDSIPVTEFTETQDIPFSISAALIEGNRDGTVRAMYWVKRVAGGTSASEILHISIGVQAMPTLDNVKDDNGEEIPEGTETVTASVSVNGTASKGRDVEIYDGSGPTAELKGTATADAVTGIWSLAGIAVAAGGRRFYAKALYNTGGTPYSNVRLFTVAAAVTPTISSVKGQPSNAEIPQGGSTVETSVILSGAASTGQEIELFDGTTSKGRFTASGGTWTSTAITVAAGAHSFTAKALYGDNPVSTARTFTQVAAVTPTIASVKGLPSNAEIPQGGSTVETSVILSGAASTGQDIELFDGTTSKGRFTASGGIWTSTAIPVAVGAHSFTAKALYGNNPVSTARTFTQVAAATPTITSVKGQPSNAEIPQGGSTVETSVILSGAASTGQDIELFDGTTSKGRFTASGGTWTSTAIPVAVGAHSFTAKALYGNNPVSTARTFTQVAAATPTITSVKGQPSNAEIPQGGSTVETSVILSGAASTGQEIELFDGTTPKGSFVATGGTWSTGAINVAPGPRSFTAKAKYGDNPVSLAHAFNVVAVVNPTLTDIADAKGSVVGGITVATSVTVTGTGSSGHKIQLRDGSTDIGDEITVPTNSTNWTTPLTGLTAKAYSIKAKALYGTGIPDSTAKSFDVTQLLPPTLASVKDVDDREIGEGIETVSTTLKLTGQASKGQKVEIFDGNGTSAVSKGQASANANTGTWNLTITVETGPHRLYAKSLYHSADIYSNVRTLRVLWHQCTRFDNGDADGWVTGSNSGGRFEIVAEGSNHYGMIHSPSIQVERYNPPTNLLRAKTYEFSLRARASVVGAKLESVVYNYSAQFRIASEMFTIESTEWRDYSYRFSSSQLQEAALWLRLPMPQIAPHNISIDNICITLLD